MTNEGGNVEGQGQYCADKVRSQVQLGNKEPGKVGLANEETIIRDLLAWERRDGILAA